MSNDVNELVIAINHSLGIELQSNISMEELRTRLADRIHYLIQYDFNKLVSLLYRIDVNEQKLRQMLDTDTSHDAGQIIADLVIERQLQKTQQRQQFRGTSENSIDENEKW